MGAKNYVCTTCAQDFTRKYSSKRHNQTLHQGQAKIVRMLDYLVGRIAGEYATADPISYRRRLRGFGVDSSDPSYTNIVHNRLSDQGNIGTWPNEENSPTGQPHIQTSPSNGSSKSLNSSMSQSHHTSPNVNNTKLDEFTLLCNRLLPYPTSETFRTRVAYELIQSGGKESVLDK